MPENSIKLHTWTNHNTLRLQQAVGWGLPHTINVILFSPKHALLKWTVTLSSFSFFPFFPGSDWWLKLPHARWKQIHCRNSPCELYYYVPCPYAAAQTSPHHRTVFRTSAWTGEKQSCRQQDTMTDWSTSQVSERRRMSADGGSFTVSSRACRWLCPCGIWVFLVEQSTEWKCMEISNKTYP